MSVVYRDRERFDDTRSTTTARTGGGTKITRYVVKDDYDDTRSRHDDRQSRYETRRAEYDEGNRHVEETRILRTSRDDYSPERAPTRAYSTRDAGGRNSRETITIRRDEEPERRREFWKEPPGERVEDRELVIRRTETDDVYRGRDGQVSRLDDRRESRFSDYEVISPQRRSFDDRERDVQRYIRNTEYYQPQAPAQPQTIIIRQEPIIIRERDRSRSRSRSRDRREEDYQVVKRSDFEEERSVARRSEPREEEYFYEKKVRERLPEDRGERRLTRREVSPGDSISQVGRRGRNRGYESDDSMVYVRKEKITEGYGSDDDGHRKRDLAAGVVAGVGAAEIIRRHNEKEGKEVSRGGGRLLKDAGAGIVGAVAAEGIRRYRSKSRRRGSRSRSRSDERSRYSRRRGDRSRSRSNSNSNLKNFGGLGLAAAAVAAGALIASRNKKDASPDGRRSRSRSRRGSRSRSRAESLVSLENDPDAKDDRNPAVRNKKTAAAGALGAAAMAIYEHHRSKSRGRGSSESPNRLKQGLPIVGGGLAAAGLAHLYEKRKAKEEAQDILVDENRRSRSRASRSRSRARTDSTYAADTRGPGYSDPNLISYGNEPLHGNNYGEGYYGRPGAPEQDYYNNNNRDMVPVATSAPPPAASSFDATSRRPRSASRTRSLSADGRSRSRSRGAAAAAAAVGAGVAASQYDKRRKDKKERKRRSRDRERARSREGSYQPYAPGADPYEDANYHATHTPSYAAGMHDPYASQSGFYPQTGQFPPPPGSMPQPGAYAPTPTPQANYGPQDFPPPPAGAPQAQQMYADPYAQHNQYAPRARGDENV